MEKIIYVVAGGQGSGKGTFAERFAKQSNSKHIGTGDIFRNLPKDSTIRKLIDAGKFVSDEEMFKLMDCEISQKSSVILDGFPRTPEQAHWLINKYLPISTVVVIYLNLPRELLKARIQERHAKSTEKRADDANQAAVDERLNKFFDLTVPGLEMLRANPNVHFKELNIQPHYSIEDTYNLGMCAIAEVPKKHSGKMAQFSGAATAMATQHMNKIK